jgi:hypothetical protein
MWSSRCEEIVVHEASSPYDRLEVLNERFRDEGKP